MTPQDFIDSTIPVTESGCWLWDKSIAPNGYGEFWEGKRNIAHRWAYETFIDPIPRGM